MKKSAEAPPAVPLSPCFSDEKGLQIIPSSSVLYSLLFLSVVSYPGSSKISMVNSGQLVFNFVPYSFRLRLQFY